MPNPKCAPRLETRKLSDLHDHPLQGCFYGGLSEYDLKELAADIRRSRGLKEPIEVLPENRAGLPKDTIVSGHQRRRALLLNGETESAVLVRYDLATAKKATIEGEFLRANQNRRHLDALSKARGGLRLFEIEKGRPPGSLSPRDEAEGRDRVGNILGMSGRNLQRYFSILKAPLVVQKAFQEKALTLVEAAKVGDLSPEDQTAIAFRLQAGEPAKEV